MRHWHRTLVAASILTAGLSLMSGHPAAAETLSEINGTYGNASGCASLTNIDDIKDDMLLLTNDHVTSYVSYCSFVKIIETGATSTTVDATCGSEGEDTEESARLTIVRNADKTVSVGFSSGEQWGPLAKCPS